MKSYAYYQAKQGGNVKKAMALSKEANNWLLLTIVCAVLIFAAGLGVAIY